MFDSVGFVIGLFCEQSLGGGSLPGLGIHVLIFSILFFLVSLVPSAHTGFPILDLVFTSHPACGLVKIDKHLWIGRASPVKYVFFDVIDRGGDEFF